MMMMMMMTMSLLAGTVDPNHKDDLHRFLQLTPPASPSLPASTWRWMLRNCVVFFLLQTCLVRPCLTAGGYTPTHVLLKSGKMRFKKKRVEHVLKMASNQFLFTNKNDCKFWGTTSWLAITTILSWNFLILCTHRVAPQENSHCDALLPTWWLEVYQEEFPFNDLGILWCPCEFSGAYQYFIHHGAITPLLIANWIC